MTIQRTANLNGICYEVAILEPPVVGQLETTVEQVGNWKEKDCYVVERQTAYGEAIARILGYGSFLGRTTLDEEGIKQVERDMAAGSNLFFLPHMTLCDHSTVDRLGINVGNFYGGIVGFEHERTKLIMHDLLHPPAIRPDGWNERFAKCHLTPSFTWLFGLCSGRPKDGRAEDPSEFQSCSYQIGYRCRWVGPICGG